MSLSELINIVLKQPPPVLGISGRPTVWLKPVRIHTANCYRPVIVGETNVMCQCGLSLTRVGSTCLFLSEAFDYGSSSYAWFVLDDAQIKLVSVDSRFDIRECLRIL